MKVDYLNHSFGLNCGKVIYTLFSSFFFFEETFYKSGNGEDDNVWALRKLHRKLRVERGIQKAEKSCEMIQESKC